MEVIPGGQHESASRKISIDTLDSAHSLYENLRKEETVVRMGHGVGRGTPHTLLEWACASVSATWHCMRNALTKYEAEVMLCSYVYNWKYNKYFKKSWYRREIPPFQAGPGTHKASCKIGTGSYLGVKCARGVLLTTHTLLVPRSSKNRAKSLPTLWATPGL